MKSQTVLITNNGDSLFTTHYPNPGKETILLLHGGPGFPSELTEVTALLCKNFAVVTFHQRGTKQSPIQSHDYSINAYLQDILNVTAFFNIDRFHLWGHSWGGLYAQIFAKKHPHRLLSLFLCCPGSGTGSEWQQTEQEVMALNRSKCSYWEWTMMGINNLLGILGSDEAYKRLFKQVMKNYNSDFTTDTITEIDFDNLKAEPINQTRKEIVRYPILEKLPNPSFPISIIYGEQDIYKSSKNFVLNRYPTAKVYFISNCGHIPWLHNPKDYSAILLAHFMAH